MGLLSSLRPTNGTVVWFRSRDYREREGYRGNYRELAAALTEVLKFETVLDVGCGQGHLLAPMLEVHRRDARGIEVNPEVQALLPPVCADRVDFGNVVDMAPPAPSDLVCAIEVAEHIPASDAEPLVEFLSLASRHYVYFTAALPRQPGVGHINCQPSFYWIDLFDRFGFALDVAATRALLTRIRHLQPCYWIPQNSLIFKCRPRPTRAGGRGSD